MLPEKPVANLSPGVLRLDHFRILSLGNERCGVSMAEIVEPARRRPTRVKAGRNSRLARPDRELPAVAVTPYK